MIEIQSIQSCWVNGEVDGSFHEPFSDLKPEIPFVFTKEPRPVVVLGDRELHLVHALKQNQKVVAWLGGEPRVVVPEAYEFVENHIDDFELVFTFDKELLGKNPKFRFCPFGTTHFSKKEDRTLKPKSKNLSIIGNVRYCRYPGHFLRTEVISDWGEHFTSIKSGGVHEDKRKFLNDFRYSVVIENSKQNHYFSEKLIDCLLVGTVPLYWGCDSLFDFGFDKRGIITFDTSADLEDVITHLGPKDYRERLPFIQHNFEVAQKYLQCYQNKYLWDNGLKELF